MAEPDITEPVVIDLTVPVVTEADDLTLPEENMTGDQTDGMGPL